MKELCFKGLIWLPLKPKNVSYFSPISVDWFMRRVSQVKSKLVFNQLFNFYQCYINRNGHQNRSERKKYPFQTKFEA